MRTTGRILLRLIRTAIFLAPVVMLVMGCRFLQQCAEALAAPGTGIDFTYEARKGAVLHVTAEAYSFLWGPGVLHVVKPKLQDSEGQLLAQAESARLEGLTISGGPIAATVRNLRGELVRLPNGRFELEDYLPEKTAEADVRPFHVRVADIDLMFEDRSGRGIFNQRLLSNELIVDGLGDDWIASGTLTLPTIGIADASMQRYKSSGMVIALNAQQLNLSRAVRHFRTTPEGRNLEPLRLIHSDTLLAQGPVRLFFPESNPFELAASINARGTNVVYAGTDRFDSAAFSGLVTGSGASGTLSITRGSAHGDFVGSTDWSRATNFAGQINAVVGTRQDIPPSLVKALPPELRFEGAKANGWFSFDEKAGFRYDGDLNAQTLTVAGRKFGGVSGVMRAGNGLVRIVGAQGTWEGSELRGNLAYYPSDKKIEGIVGGPQIRLDSIARTINLSGLSGTAAGQALLKGTIDDPVATIRAGGVVAYRGPKAGKSLRGNFVGAGTYTAKGLDVTSLSIDTKTGTVAATGHADPNGALALNVAARGVSLNAFAPDIGGLASFNGRIGGTASNPQLDGKVQVVQLEVADHQIPLVIGDIKADKNRLTATSIDAARGAAQANGDIAYNFATGGISGSLKAANLSLSEFSDQIEGFLDISNAKIAGTINSPIVDADVATHAMVVADRSIGPGQAHLSLRGDEFSLPNISARFAGGTVTGSATGNLETKVTRVQLEGKDLELPDLVPEASQTTTLAGKLNGTGVATLSGTELRYARASGQLTDVKVNQTLVGNGPWNANVDPNAFSTALQIGMLDRYFDVSNLSVNRKTDQIDAKLAAYLIPLQDIYSAAQRYIPEPSTDLERRLYRVQGTADAEATISGKLSDPDLRVSVLNLTKLSLEGKDLGEMKFSFDKAGRVWTVAEASWNGLAGTLRSSGRADLDNDIVFEGDFTNVDLGLLSIIDDNLTRIGGRGAISFAVSGPTQSPLIQASLDASRTTVLTGSRDTSPALEFGMVLDTIHISQSVLGVDGKLAGGIEASGKMFYRGLEGNINANVPLKYPLTLPEGHPLFVSLDFPQRELQTLGEYLPGLDVNRTQGTIRGNVTMSGLIGDAKINGQLTAEAQTLAVNKVQSTLSNTVASVTANTDALKLHFEGLGSEGGSILFDASSPIGDVSERIRDLTSRGLDSLLDRPVNGALAINDFGIRYNGGAANGRLTGRANAKITATGPLRRPAVEGTANVSNVATLLPSWEVTPGEPITFAIDPTFNVKLGVDNIAEVSTSLAKLRVIGDGSLTGSLNKPSVSSDLTVMGGTVSLPTASVRIDPGGSVRLRYQTGPAGDAIASLDVDLTGHTSLTTLDAGDVPQRYDITLTIRGDLLQEGQTLVSAESDPPGLSQDRIVALLGQADLIQALAGSVTNLQASKELRNVLAGVALPALLSPLTGGLAKGLGLDYLDITYDPLNQVSMSFAKDLGKNLAIQGTRQVSQPPPGIKPQFDLRLAYRLPFKGKEFRRTTVTFGVDQDRPWKVGLQYSIRF